MPFFAYTPRCCKIHSMHVPLLLAGRIRGRTCGTGKRVYSAQTSTSIQQRTKCFARWDLKAKHFSSSLRIRKLCDTLCNRNVNGLQGTIIQERQPFRLMPNDGHYMFVRNPKSTQHTWYDHGKSVECIRNRCYCRQTPQQ